jgi:hypothetical protein
MLILGKVESCSIDVGQVGDGGSFKICLEGLLPVEE